MSYSPEVLGLLKGAGAEEGDLLLLIGRGREYRGILMPHHDFSHPDIIIIKLLSGYNIGLRRQDVEGIELLEKVERREEAPATLSDGAAGKAVIIGTGGTIASYVDYRTGGVHPALSAEDLVSAVPEIADLCEVRAEVLFSIFSENMNVERWRSLAAEVADRLNEGAEGCIIPHGTDTMGYTSAALSFMLERPPRSVILVGAQRSSDRPSSDAYTNLLSAARFAVQTDAAEVCVLMHESPSDLTALVHRGTCVRKMHTSRRDAFVSINKPPIARVDFEGGIEFLSDYSRRSEGKVVLRDSMEEDVALLHFYPGMSPSRFREVVLGHTGVVIAGSGLGHVSSEMVDLLSRAVREGIPVVMTSQCLSGRVNLNVYDTGRDLLSAGVMPGEDMLPETAYVKLMWVLGQTSDLREIRRLMGSNLRGEISQRRELDG